MRDIFTPDPKFIDEDGRLRADARKAILDLYRSKGWEVLKHLMDQKNAGWLKSTLVPLTTGLGSGVSLEALAVARDAELSKRQALLELEQTVVAIAEEAQVEEVKG